MRFDIVAAVSQRFLCFCSPPPPTRLCWLGYFPLSGGVFMRFRAGVAAVLRSLVLLFFVFVFRSVSYIHALSCVARNAGASHVHEMPCRCQGNSWVAVSV